MNLNDPYLRVLARIVAVAAAIRLVFVLIAPVALYLLIAVIAIAVTRFVCWYRDRDRW